MGLPAAGKSTLASTFVAQGYQRVNRDQAGGSLRESIPAGRWPSRVRPLEIVLDNTYVTPKSRAPVIHAARARGLPSAACGSPRDSRTRR